MDEEKEIAVSYQLTPHLMKFGVSEGYNIRFKYRRWLIFFAGVILILLGGILLLKDNSGLSLFYHCFIFTMGVFYVMNKLIYVSRSVKRVFAGKEKLINAVFIAREDGYEMRTDNDEAKSKWKSIVKYRCVDKGILLYPQKHLFYYIPIEGSDITGGSWTDFVSVIQRNVNETVK